MAVLTEPKTGYLGGAYRMTYAAVELALRGQTEIGRFHPDL